MAPAGGLPRAESAGAGPWELRHAAAAAIAEAQAELAGHPDDELIVAGRGPGGALARPVAEPCPDRDVVDAAPYGAAPGRAINGRPLRRPTPRQLAGWKAIQQAQLQALSIRATARLLGISHVTAGNGVQVDEVLGPSTGAKLHPYRCCSTLTKSLLVDNH